jgi:hypothetical protein
VDWLWPRQHVATRAPPNPCLHQRSQVLDQMPTREMAARDDLAGGESHGAWATGHNGATTWNPLWLLGSKGARPELVAVAVRPSPVWARRRRRGGGVGDSSQCGNVRTCVRRRARGSAHAQGKHHS